jgi:hypothetical protein
VSAKTTAAMRELLAKAVDAVADGDKPYALASLDQLGRLLDEQVVKQKTRKAPAHRCAECGIRFNWPGELADHARHQHPEIA